MADLALKPLSATAGRGALRSQWLAARTAAVLSLAAAWIHLAYIESHWRDWWAYGAFFLACGIAQGLFVPAILRWPQRSLVLVGIVGNLAIVGMYVVSRTAGVPMGPHARVAERAGAIDLACTAAEIALIGVLLVMIGRVGRRWILNAMLVAGAVLWILRLTGRLP
ncbi:MAG: hypothetical protein QOI62_1104 [Solirubrobacteraceae bacterium]|jgi:hypothetical protein|nr:hypothetical protein [Solirubrobacteraceae bacterium]MEA2357844.1 hypothetical protein [Solirubrobacteraceae bacterium]MEA2395709.1 hypothetical protein [Solirubrobacteraceae bacterium]